VYGVATTTLSPPDLNLDLRAEPQASWRARHAVAAVDRPSPDLRDAVMLLASELVAAAVASSPTGAHVFLRLWMPKDVVRLEVDAGTESEELGELRLRLVRELADRWGMTQVDDRGGTRIWLEIDRQQ
jgi:hypothetical protein